MAEAFLKIEHLKKYFKSQDFSLISPNLQIKAVDDISFTVEKSETLGIVGESGCGKSTVARLILRLIEPTDGKVLYNGRDLLLLNNEQMRKIRSELQIVFQDPYSSLNPRMRVFDIISEPIRNHGGYSRSSIKERVNELLNQVGLDTDYASRYPHEFSGGQRQRIGIARAISVNPKLIICDEAVSALDVSVQSQTLNLFRDLQDKYGFTYIFISHGLNVIKYMSNHILVMYLGKIMEFATKESIFASQTHPYTQALFSAVPNTDRHTRKQRIVLDGDIPSPINPPAGCRFRSRCWLRQELCDHNEPLLREVGAKHYVACHLSGK
ncbi:MAG: ATP-binding cassette domain-containing protein [Clostridiales bacterium]|jgi:oligopeptide/dipeptide ABC transporter ATP-binding protein|nr:ATP-binding cassette domain-containing protein [Clostridiales bacterium]